VYLIYYGELNVRRYSHGITPRNWSRSTAWFELKGIVNVKPLADGNGEFTHKIGAECKKSNVGFGYRSWRYAVVLNDGLVESVFIEEGFQDNIESDPYEASSPENVLSNL
jgi:thioredoxin-dependent peroxiredoxin